MKFPCTGVILAGGLNTRFSGLNKAFIRIRGQYILDYIYDVFKELFQEIILVTNEPLQYLDRDFMITTDLFPIRSSLTGIHAGLFCAANPYAFFIACDTPFLKKELIEILLEAIEPGTDIIIPETSAGLEPLCAVYSKKCLLPAEQQLRKDLRIRGFFKKMRVKKIPEHVLRKADTDLISFFNINTPEELARAEELIPEHIR
ncbi:molybdenum cofactor guanylyltransferase [Desulfococcaceae bacterium HSG8]|nr:molybdenum cofactor guanylyltransferase [Desulfococcaceae bacterium HSG8]